MTSERPATYVLSTGAVPGYAPDPANHQLGSTAREVGSGAGELHRAGKQGAGPEQVLGYLGRYNPSRRPRQQPPRRDRGRQGQLHLQGLHDGKTKTMTLEAEEFIRRFLQHTVPDGFHRIRHIGFLANLRNPADCDHQFRSIVITGSSRS